MSINWKFWRRKKLSAPAVAVASVVATAPTVHVCPECGWKYAAAGPTPCPNAPQHPKKE